MTEFSLLGELRGDTTGKTLFFQAPVNFEILRFLAFHRVFFQTGGKKISKIHLKHFIYLHLYISIRVNIFPL